MMFSFQSTILIRQNISKIQELSDVEGDFTFSGAGVYFGGGGGLKKNTGMYFYIALYLI